MRFIKQVLKRGFRKLFEGGQRFARIDILPHHFYSEIPDISELKRSHDWRKERSMAGVRGAETAAQLEFVRECCPEALRQLIISENIYLKACRENGQAGFGPIETDFLFCFMSVKRPKRVIQIGCGVSTAAMLLASERSKDELEMICIDPFPTEFLKRAAEKGRIRLIAKGAQAISLETLTDLKGGDMLFVDSTHTVKPGSEVNRIIFEVLPRLNSGVYVHFHDIYFPFDYQRTVLSEELFFHNENSLLLAFLAQNSKYAIKASLSMLHYAMPEQLQELLPNYRPQENCLGLRSGNLDGHFPSSTYLMVS